MGRVTRKTIAAVLAVLCICALMLTGCVTVPAEQVTLGNVWQSETIGNTTLVDEVTETTEDKIVLRIVIEEGSDETIRFDELLMQQIEFYEVLHKNVEFVLEYIPKTDGNDVVLQRIRSEMLAGDGPDIFLLSCEQNYKTQPLITDVNQAMRNGMFTDISKYYDADNELGKDALNSTVMDAGVVNGARYVLPIRYNFPVAYVDADRLTEMELSAVKQGVLSLMDTVAQSEDKRIASNALLANVRAQYTLNFFPNILDYDNQEILITKEELMTYMRSYQAVRFIEGDGQNRVHIFTYLNHFPTPYWAETTDCLLLDDLEAAIANVAMAEVYGVNLEMFPLTAADGSLIADVTFYGAVGAECKHPDVAYDFLRQFLTEDVQWETKIQTWSDPIKPTGLGREGWPVRTTGSVSPLAKGLVKQNHGVSSEKMKELKLLEMTDEDIPLLQAKIDKVRFSIPLELDLEKKIREELNANSTESDMSLLADQWLKELEWHLYEG